MSGVIICYSGLGLMGLFGSTNNESASEETWVLLYVEEELEDAAGSAWGGGQIVNSAEPFFFYLYRDADKVKRQWVKPLNVHTIPSCLEAADEYPYAGCTLCAPPPGRCRVTVDSCWGSLSIMLGGPAFLEKFWRRWVSASVIIQARQGTPLDWSNILPMGGVCCSRLKSLLTLSTSS
jgi:hypothetical protein